MSDSVLFVIEKRPHRSRRNVVSAITKYAAPAELLFPPAGGEKDASLEAEAEFSLPGTICQSALEWRRIAAPKASMIEMFVLVLFLVVTVVAVSSCFVELSRLLESDAVGHLAAKAIQGGGSSMWFIKPEGL
jgi:hypothetical protein